MRGHQDVPVPDPWEPWEAHEHNAARPPALEVEVTEPDVAGVLYGPRGELLAVVEHDRPPFGFHP